MLEDRLSTMDEFDAHDNLPYLPWNQLDFSIITMGMKHLPFFEDDVYLGMQAMNVGVIDSIATDFEYRLLREYFEIEKTPLETALAVSALSQMWVYGLYEVLRMWRDRRYQFDKLFKNGGIDSKLEGMQDNDPLNLTIDIRKEQLKGYKDQPEYRQAVEDAWERIESVYRMTELFRMNLAKHCAPGSDGVIPRAPGYGRINKWCGAMDYELIVKDGNYTTMNRRDIADALRYCLSAANQ